MQVKKTEINNEYTSGKGRILSGKVISNKRDKTVTVAVVRQFRHPLYGKIVRKTKHYHAHVEEKLNCDVAVDILECRPISKTKTWIVSAVYNPIVN